MDRDQVLETYDREYARTYDERFILPGHYGVKTEFEVKLLRRLMPAQGKWLDVACGTGYFLSRFPGVPRAGLDLSSAMLARAREANPDALLFREGDFTHDMPDWRGEWDLVTCMWYAYGMVQSLAEVARVVGNLAAWTSERGTCFLPLFDPRKLRGVSVPYLHENVAFPPGTVLLTGVTWTWIESSGKRHQDMVAPATEVMVELFERHFDSVELVRYPSPRWRGRGRHVKALVARGKRPQAD
jgi:SAM-dependent methyltransferase